MTAASVLGFERTPVLTDGAWGTEFQKRGLRPGEPADLWNLSRPDEVIAVAASYVAAGSEVILTNTFRANPHALAALGAEAVANLAEINRAGVRLSREAAGGRAKVFASVGPVGKLLSAGEIGEDEVREALRAQVEALAGAGPDAILFETFGDLAEARLAAQVGRATGLPVVVSFAFDSGKGHDRTMMGVTPEQAGAAMRDEGVAAVGANCGAGPDAFVGVCRRLGDASGLPVWVKANAGLPAMQGGRAVYNLAPGDFAAFLPALVAAGAAFVGGCCGTTPEFVAALDLARSRLP
jgi:methionine synthase I (cobalamin-dependent)